MVKRVVSCIKRRYLSASLGYIFHYAPFMPMCMYCSLLCMLLLTRIAHHSKPLLKSLIFLPEIIIMKEEGASERARWAVFRVEYVSHEKYVIALVTLAILEHTVNR